jgi:hypothetical protein
MRPESGPNQEGTGAVAYPWRVVVHVKRGLIALAVVWCAAGCGTSDPPKAAPAPATDESDDRDDAEAAAGDAHASARATTTISAEEYWYARALGRVRAELEREGGLLVDVLADDGKTVPCLVARSAIQDGEARAFAYQRAVRTLGQTLTDPSDAKRAEAAERLEHLTKTQRGPAGPWLAWYREFGDFLRWNAELERMEVDEERMASRTPFPVDGLELRLSGPTGRVKRGQKIPVTATLQPTADASPRWVQTRLTRPDDIEFEVVLEEDARSTPVEMVKRSGGEALVAADFSQLGPGARTKATFDLAQEVEGGLEPGHYAVRARYTNDDDGSAMGIDTVVGDTDDAGVGSAWTGSLESLTVRFRVVPW